MNELKPCLFCGESDVRDERDKEKIKMDRSILYTLQEDELISLIAKMKGYDIRHLAVVWEEKYDKKGEEFFPQYVCPRCGTSEYALDRFPCTPDWVGKIEDAWELFEELPVGTFLKKNKTGYSCQQTSSSSNSIDFYEVGDTPQLAICRAWVSWCKNTDLKKENENEA